MWKRVEKEGPLPGSKHATAGACFMRVSAHPMSMDDCQGP